jgi:hypothetical protein
MGRDLAEVVTSDPSKENQLSRLTPRKGVRVATALALASGTAGLATLVSFTSTAQADPSFVSGYVGVGADVTQDAYAAFSGASPAPPSSATINYFQPIHSSAATNNRTIDSFDANPSGGTTVNPGCITTKAGGPSFDRPNSTTAGLAALLASVTGSGFVNTSGSCTGTAVSTTGQIDFARAARGPKTSGTTLTFIPFARDALGIVYYDHSTGHAATLTTAQLTSLYSSSTGTITLSGGDTLKACLTISGSTPRSNLATTLGLTDTQLSTAATAAGCNNLIQNSGNAFFTVASGFPAGTDAVVPISSGSWISQANLLAVDRSNTARAGGADLATITGFGKPYTGTAPSEAPNTTYYQSDQTAGGYGYNVFTVVPTAKLSGFTKDAGLVSLFSGATSALCSAPEQTIANSFGFDSLTVSEGTCGDTTVTGNG